MISVVVPATLVTDARSRSVCLVMGSPGWPAAGSRAQPPSATAVPGAGGTPPVVSRTGGRRDAQGRWPGGQALGPRQAAVGSGGDTAEDAGTGRACAARY